MKTFFLILATGLLLGGCSDSKRVAELEQRVKALEDHRAKDIADLKEIDRQMLEEQDKFTTNMLTGFEQLTNSEETEYMDTVVALTLQQAAIDRLSNSIAIIESGRFGSARPTPAAHTQSTTLANGMPSDVFAQIKSDAEKEWPGNYDMQAYEIRKQTEAWLKLHAQ